MRVIIITAGDKMIQTSSGSGIDDSFMVTIVVASVIPTIKQISSALSLRHLNNTRAVTIARTTANTDSKCENYKVKDSCRSKF